MTVKRYKKQCVNCPRYDALAAELAEAKAQLEFMRRQFPTALETDGNDMRAGPAQEQEGGRIGPSCDAGEVTETPPGHYESKIGEKP